MNSKTLLLFFDGHLWFRLMTLFFWHPIEGIGMNIWIALEAKGSINMQLLVAFLSLSKRDVVGFKLSSCKVNYTD